MCREKARLSSEARTGWRNVGVTQLRRRRTLTGLADGVGLLGDRQQPRRTFHLGQSRHTGFRDRYGWVSGLCGLQGFLEYDIRCGEVGGEVGLEGERQLELGACLASTRVLARRLQALGAGFGDERAPLDWRPRRAPRRLQGSQDRLEIRARA